MPEPIRILVTGGRAYKNREAVFKALDALAGTTSSWKVPPVPVHIIHGACPTGADKYADQWVDSRHVTCERFRADWNKWGKAAGPIRNQLMIDRGKPHYVVAFPGDVGTADMVDRAHRHGIRVIDIKE